MATPNAPRASGPCGLLTVDDTGSLITLDTRWAVQRRPDGPITGLLSPRGQLRWIHAETVCRACGYRASAHLPPTREETIHHG